MVGLHDAVSSQRWRWRCAMLGSHIRPLSSFCVRTFYLLRSYSLLYVVVVLVLVTLDVRLQPYCPQSGVQNFTPDTHIGASSWQSTVVPPTSAQTAHEQAARLERERTRASRGVGRRL
jgi:hypothetical protein